MSTPTASLCLQPTEWDDAVNSLSGHPMQLWGWGQAKARHGWAVERYVVHDGAELIGSAQVLYRKLPFPFRSLAYIPRGPQSAPEKLAEVLAAVEVEVRKRKPVALTLEPDWDAGGLSDTVLEQAGYTGAATHILIPRTLILDLSKSEDELQAAMTKKTRQYIRKSAREDLDYRRVRPEEIQQCLEVYKLTAARANFPLHEDNYYQHIAEYLGEASPIFGAFDGEKLLAFLWLATSDATAFELYGGMNDDGASKRANFNLKWTAIAAMRRAGVRRYDFNGLLNDGVSQFKIGFADHENQLSGSWDKPLSPLYPVYAQALPQARAVLRQTRKLLKR